MAESSETKRLWRTTAIVAVVGLVVLVLLGWLAVRMYNDRLNQRVISSNEAAALAALEGIQAAEQLYFESHGEYATFPQLVEAGVFQAPTKTDVLVSEGYSFTIRVTPKTDTQGPAYGVNADPLRSGGRDATGRRHFFVSSEVTGVRYNEERPATAADKPRQNVQEY